MNFLQRLSAGRHLPCSIGASIGGVVRTLKRPAVNTSQARMSIVIILQALFHRQQSPSLALRIFPHLVMLTGIPTTCICFIAH